MPTLFLTTSGTFSPPLDWPGFADKIECLGPGGNGFNVRRTTTTGSAGGGGGEYSAALNVAATSGAVYTVGTGGSQTNTVFTGTSVTVNGHAGLNALSGTAGTGGTGSTNTTHFNGGTGFAPATGTANGGGGGGAGGPSGAGSTATGQTGGAADNNTVAGGITGNPGNSGTEFDGTHGCGSGGPGGTGTGGGNGGAYGGGSGGHGNTNSTNASTGGNGLIIITYTSIQPPANPHFISKFQSNKYTFLWNNNPLSRQDIMTNPWNRSASPVVFLNGPGGGGTDVLSGLPSGQSKGLGSVSAPGVTPPAGDFEVGAITITMAATAGGIIELYLMTSTSGTAWTGGIDPTSTSDQEAKVAAARLASPNEFFPTQSITVPQSGGSQTVAFAPFFVLAKTGGVPTYWTVLVRNRLDVGFSSASALYRMDLYAAG